MSENGVDDNSGADSDAGQSWRGSSMDEIHYHLNEFELDHVPPVRPGDMHTVLHHYPIRAADTEPPRPLRGHHKWDAHHVRLPCSPKSQYPVTGDDGNVTIESRWEMIEKALLRPISNSHELEAAILSYNSKYEDQWKFRALHQLFEDDLDESETQVFFEDLLPRIVRSALRLPEVVQSAIPLLKQGQTRSVTLTQEQVACLLANGFLCTFPRRNTMKRKSEYSTFPDINFNRLFQSTGQSVLEKIKCICHYFRRVCPTEQDCSNVPTGVVTFTRRSLHYSEMPNWSECLAPFGATPLHITASGTIEDQGLGLLQVDFANKFLGGGVLGSGCVQEEIRFVICPELLVSKLFTECLRPTEALLMVGCERYSNYSGYASTFQWDGDYEDATPRDSSRRRQTHIVAIDALAFVQSSHQYREELMLRELNKAYVGFLHPLETPAPGVASGNWGCGAFGGEARLKALLQLMACVVTKRPLVYFTFGNVELRDAVYELHTHLREQQVRVCDLWATLKKFQAKRLASKELYNFIYSCHGKQLLETRSRKDQKPTTIPTKHNVQHAISSTKTTKHQPLVDSSASSAATASTSKNSAYKKQLNVSEDLFAAYSSDSDAAIAEYKDVMPSSVATTISQASSCILISDEMETDALLVAASSTATGTIELADKVIAKSTNNLLMAAVAAKSPAKSPLTKRKLKKSTSLISSPSSSQKKTEPRQRSLLDMLDRYYDKEHQAKRPKS